MSLHQYFKSKLQTMEPGETVTYTRDALASLVKREEPSTHDPLREESSPEGSSGTAEECHSVAELAERFGRGVSTVRGWCAAGLFGDPAECKKGRGWSIPESRVQEVETRRKDGWRIVDNGWVRIPAKWKGQFGPNGRVGSEQVAGARSEATLEWT